MEALRIILLVVHVTAAALLLGAPVGVARTIKSSLDSSKSAFESAARDGARRAAIASGGSLIVLLTGIALIFTVGGFARAPINFHMALGIMLVALVVSAVIVRPMGTKLVDLAKAETIDKDAARSLIKRQAMGVGILHLLWLSMLTLMFVRMYR